MRAQCAHAPPLALAYAGVVNSLLTIVTFSLLSAVPAALDEPQNLPQKRAYAIITATAMMANMARWVVGQAALIRKGCSKQGAIRASTERGGGGGL